MIKILPEPVVLIAADGEILMTNPAFCRVLSKTVESLAGVRLAEISPDPAKLRAQPADGDRRAQPAKRERRNSLLSL
jgi:PAS domain-containing protein